MYSVHNVYNVYTVYNVIVRVYIYICVTDSFVRVPNMCNMFIWSHIVIISCYFISCMQHLTACCIRILSTFSRSHVLQDASDSASTADTARSETNEREET